MANDNQREQEPSGWNAAPVEHLWVVKKDGQLFVGYPHKRQSEVYASGMSTDKNITIEMMTLHPLSRPPADETSGKVG